MFKLPNTKRENSGINFLKLLYLYVVCVRICTRAGICITARLWRASQLSPPIFMWVLCTELRSLNLLNKCL